MLFIHRFIHDAVFPVLSEMRGGGGYVAHVGNLLTVFPIRSLKLTAALNNELRKHLHLDHGPHGLMEWDLISSKSLSWENFWDAYSDINGPQYSGLKTEHVQLISHRFTGIMSAHLDSTLVSFVFDDFISTMSFIIDLVPRSLAWL